MLHVQKIIQHTVTPLITLSQYFVDFQDCPLTTHHGSWGSVGPWRSRWATDLQMIDDSTSINIFSLHSIFKIRYLCDCHRRNSLKDPEDQEVLDLLCLL